MGKDFYKFREKKEVKEKPNLKFDVMLHGRFVKTFNMPYSGGFISEEDIKKYVEAKMPLTLKGQDYNLVFADNENSVWR